MFAWDVCFWLPTLTWDRLRTTTWDRLLTRWELNAYSVGAEPRARVQARAGKCVVGFRSNAVEIDPTEKRGVEFLTFDGEWNLKAKRMIPTQVYPPPFRTLPQGAVFIQNPQP